jgi:hypothetical protein
MKCWFAASAACLAGLILADSSLAAPGNDHFHNALLLAGTNITASGSNEGATLEAGEANYSGNPGGKSVWWKWTAPAAGSVVMHTVGSDFDTILTVYAGSTLAGLRFVAVNDDHGSLKTSQVAFNVTPATTYQISVDGFNGASGQIQLTLIYRAELIRAPENDHFQNRIHLRGSAITISGANFLATREPEEPNHAKEPGGASLWWSWTAPVSGRVSIDTVGSTFDTLLAVYLGQSLTNLTEVASNDDASPDQAASAVQFQATANAVYQIAVDGFNAATGEVRLRVLMADVAWFDSPQLLPDNTLKLRFGAAPGQQVILEASPDLLNWSQLEIITSTDGTAAYIDLAGARAPQRFYRARMMPESGSLETTR